MAKKTPRPARTLLVFGLVIVVLYGLAALGGSWKPRLGLDLEGGTRITLSALEDGDAVTPTKLKQAASIVDRRVNGSGVSEAEVSTSGNRNIIVEIPGKNASNLVEAVQRTAQLRFRLVAGAPQPGTPAASQSASPTPSSKATPSCKASPSGKATSDAEGQPGDSQAETGTVRRSHSDPRGTLGLGAGGLAERAAPGQRQGCAGRPAARVVAGPGRRVAHQVRQVHLPDGQ